ncbi:GGDEF domain-containing phosphodiesterase [Neobacillus rhizophilus]|uniref:EAL domain-containing protein n=1 Tax=Neobacillus rhizophilus TaxID=2833579 RepID=A0A942U7Y1_9BACI|nr:GGDEF domain-containing phosphodiesterase [Neobacillus rhizophilus]MBS4214283.1 EAL domain-containing protein [Neobacillus rhizophilus]
MGIKKLELNQIETDSSHNMNIFDIGIWDYDVIEDEAYWSEKAYEIFGVDRDQVPTLELVYGLIHPDDRVRFIHQVHKSIEDKCGFHDQWRIIKNNNIEQIIDLYADVILDENGLVIRLIGYVANGSYQEPFLQQAIDYASSLNVSIWSKNLINNKIICSKSIESICGYSVDQFENREIRWEDLIIQEELEIYERKQKNLMECNKIKTDYRIKHKNGEIRWVRDETIPVLDSNRNLVRLNGIIKDISEEKNYEERMHHLAFYDYLTDLPNRRMIDKVLKDIVNESSQSHNNSTFAVICLDLDGFKRINDTFGHLIGDQLLIEVSNRIKSMIDQNDILARMGGDEFLLVIEYAKDDSTKVISLANRIIHSFEESLHINQYELFISTSIGITYYQGEKEYHDLIRKADSALYRAKSTGKNNYKIYSTTMNRKFLKQYNLEKDLRKAFHKNELVMYYQPKFNTQSKKIVGLEALVRWNHYQHGLILPGEFIPVAEESNLIFKLTEWTFRAVCNQIKQWEKNNVLLVPISINISPKFFLKNHWDDTLHQIMNEIKVNPNLLELEITESSLIQNEEHFISGILRLKKEGIKVSLDDFGTGYSSLLYLQKFQIDTVKIDQRFTKKLLENHGSIARYIINLAHELNVDVIAEGVESEEQLTFLSLYGCNQVQGFLLSKPAPEKVMEKLLVLYN